MAAPQLRDSYYVCSINININQLKQHHVVFPTRRTIISTTRTRKKNGADDEELARARQTVGCAGFVKFGFPDGVYLIREDRAGDENPAQREQRR